MCLVAYWTCLTVPGSRLREYTKTHQTKSFQQTVTAMPRRHGKKEDKSEDVYEIKSILAYEKRDGEDYYHIEWDGYPLSEATWEPR